MRSEFRFSCVLARKYVRRVEKRGLSCSLRLDHLQLRRAKGLGLCPARDCGRQAVVPLTGTARTLGKIVLADDAVAADATCARLMGFEPERIVHIREGSRFLGNSAPELLEQVGETVNAPATPFEVVPDFQDLLRVA